MEYVRCLSAVARFAVYVVYDICRSLCLGNEGADRQNALAFTHGFIFPTRSPCKLYIGQSGFLFT